MSIKLVIADDAPFVREVVKQIVSEAGIEVVGEAADGHEVVELTKQLKPDVVLMDIVMPKKNGLDAVREILESLPETSIIGCSTVNDESLVMKAINAGCCDFLAKPFKKEDLVKVVFNSVGED